MNGNLAYISFPDIIRELHLTRRTGLLRLVQGKILRAIFVEEGRLVFALSNLPTERLGEFLLREDRISRDQYDLAMQNPNSKQRLGKVLVEMGVLTSEEADAETKRQITEIILAGFQSSEGDFSFEEGTRAAHDVKLDLLTPNIILMGVRRIEADDMIRKAVGPLSQVIQMSPDAPIQLMGATLDGTEGFVLSRITDPISIDDLVSISGVPESMIVRVVFGLLCAGILTSNHPRPALKDHTSSGPSRIAAPVAAPPRPTPPVAQATPAVTPPPIPPPIASPPAAPVATPPSNTPTSPAGVPAALTEAEARDELRRIMYEFSKKTTTYYSILEVGTAASDAEIKKSYYQLAKKYHPDRFKMYGDRQMLTDAEQVFAKISEAHEKLRDPATRERYDDFLGITPTTTPASPPANAPDSRSFTPPVTPLRPVPPANAPDSRSFAPPVTPLRPVPPPATPPANAPDSRSFTPPVPRPVPVTPPANAPDSRGFAPPITLSGAPPVVPPSRPTTPPANGPGGGIPPAPTSGPLTNSGSQNSGDVGYNTTGSLRGPAMTPMEIAQRSFQYAQAAMVRKDLLMATKYLREAVKQTPDHVPFRLHLAQICSQTPKLRKEAEAHLLHILKQEPQNIDALLLLGNTYKLGGLEKSARAQFEAVLKIKPNHPLATKALNASAAPKPAGKPEDDVLDMDGLDETPAKTAEKPKEGASFLNKLFKR